MQTSRVDCGEAAAARCQRLPRQGSIAQIGGETRPLQPDRAGACLSRPGASARRFNSIAGR